MDTREFRAALRSALDANEGDRDSQVAAVEALTAREIEERSRTPQSQRGPGRKQEQQRGRKTA